MCGIVGGLTPAGDRDRGVVEELNRQQAHRGPDAEVVVHEGLFLLGNTRLAVQDPTPAANQPFRDPSGRFVVVFNGEIYNFRELAREHGLAMRTACDGEIIPLLWERMGPACLDLFRGMFSVAVADLAEGHLYLARDPFGIKPLYWRRHDDGFLFASEVKPLWRVDRRLPLDEESLGRYLTLGAVAVDRSPFAGIDSLAPGECLRFALGGEPARVHLTPALGHLDALGSGADGSVVSAFRESVRLHLNADVPTALLLSAGLDSSLIAKVAAECGQSLHCLTVGGVLGDDESPQAQATATEFGHTHEEVPAVLDDDVVAAYFQAMQRPSIDGLNTFLVSRAVHTAGFKVALSGLGGDEALAGYRTARVADVVDRLGPLDRAPEALARPARRLLRRVLPGASTEKADRLLARGGPRTPADFVLLQREVLGLEVVRGLGLDRAADEVGAIRGGPAHRELALAELVLYMEPMLLQDTDAFSMAVSVEMRVPFVDRVLFASAMDRTAFRGKTLLVDAFGDHYLSLLKRRAKTGFAVPMTRWIREGALSPIVEQAREPSAPVWHHVDRTAGLALLDALTTTERWAGPWTLCALDAWLRSL